MTLCRDGNDICGATCRDGVAVDTVCRDAAQVCTPSQPSPLDGGANSLGDMWCNIAYSPGCAQYVLQWLANGDIREGNTNTPLSTTGTWQDGSAPGGDYEILLVVTGGSVPTTGPVNTWLSLGSTQTFVWDLCSPGDDFVTVHFTIRNASDPAEFAEYTWCFQLGVDTYCQQCP